MAPARIKTAFSQRGDIGKRPERWLHRAPSAQQRLGSGARIAPPLPRKCTPAPVLTVIAENPSPHRGNTRWRDIIQAVTLKA